MPEQRLDLSSSILVSNNTGSCEGYEFEITGCKCSCGSVWCPVCFKKRRVPGIVDRLRHFNPESTRLLVLTIDPKNFKDGEEAYLHVTSKKLIPQLIHNLKRTKGIKINDWIRFLEFHRNGFPHWHLFIDVTEKGKKGMIGGINIRQYWNLGAVHEDHVKSERHWHYLTGYFKKTGYFEKNKAHQVQLPEWALKSNKRIRRCDSMRIKKKQTVIKAKDEIDKQQISKKEKSSEKNTYKEILNTCGSQTNCNIRRKSGRSFWQKIDMPFNEFTTLPGEYVQSKGYVTYMTFSDAHLLFALYGDANRLSTH